MCLMHNSSTVHQFFGGMPVLQIILISVNGTPVQPPLLAEFSEAGGGIGRDERTLVLPDPERRLSRVQAVVQFEHGAYRLIDQGASPTLLNGIALRKGNSRLLREGDLIEAVGFKLKVVLPRCPRTEILRPGEPIVPSVGLPKDPFDELLAEEQGESGLDLEDGRIRRILEVLELFHPESLERRFQAVGAVTGNANQENLLWSLYLQHFPAIAREAALALKHRQGEANALVSDESVSARQVFPSSQVS